MFRHSRYGDVWLRDTGRSSCLAPASSRNALCVRRLGRKYVMAGDTDVSAQVTAWTGIAGARFDFVLEGGAIEVDGEGTLITTRSCLLDGVRNPEARRRGHRSAPALALGAEHVIWLERGLANDHTDGHVDTLARFVAPGVVAAMEPARPGDPNGDVLDSNHPRAATRPHRARERLEVVTVVSPGDVGGLPASYMNFYVANTTVVVPTYGVANDDRAITTIQTLFPGRRAVGVPARAILVGGVAFHCCTQQQPRVSWRR